MSRETRRTEMPSETKRTPGPCLCGRHPAYRYRRADGSPRQSGKMRVRHKCPHGAWCVRGERQWDNWNEPKCLDCRAALRKARGEGE